MVQKNTDRIELKIIFKNIDVSYTYTYKMTYYPILSEIWLWMHFIDFICGINQYLQMK